MEQKTTLRIHLRQSKDDTWSLAKLAILFWIKIGAPASEIIRACVRRKDTPDGSAQAFLHGDLVIDLRWAHGIYKYTCLSRETSLFPKLDKLFFLHNLGTDPLSPFLRGFHILLRSAKVPR
jgi:hypothetical protein